MSGLEVAALVVAIVSAFTGAATVFQTWKAGKDSKKAAKALSQSLTVSAPQVQENYNQHLKQLGDRFGKGDDVARRALSDIVIIMQDRLLKSIISLLNGSANGGTEYLQNLMSLSGNSRLNTIKVLGEQAQRFAIAAPIPTSPGVSEEWICDVCQHHYHGGSRYRCVQCADYDMCNNCFHFRHTEHLREHCFSHMGAMPSIPPGASLHWYCDVCNHCFHAGAGYRCVECPDYDMCTNCFRSRREEHTKQHGFRQL